MTLWLYIHIGYDQKKMLSLDLEYQAALIIPLSKAAERQTNKTRNMVQQNLGQPYFINDIQ